MTIIAAMHEPGVGTWIGSDTMDFGFTPKESDEGGPAVFDATFLFATPTRIVALSSVGDAMPIQPMCIATQGSGCDVADATAMSIQRSGKPEFQTPEMIVRLAVTAAGVLDRACDGLWMNCLRLDGAPYQPNQKDLDMTRHGRDP